MPDIGSESFDADVERDVEIDDRVIEHSVGVEESTSNTSGMVDEWFEEETRFNASHISFIVE